MKKERKENQTKIQRATNNFTKIESFHFSTCVYIHIRYPYNFSYTNRNPGDDKSAKCNSGHSKKKKCDDIHWQQQQQYQNVKREKRHFGYGKRCTVYVESKLMQSHTHMYGMKLSVYDIFFFIFLFLRFLCSRSWWTSTMLSYEIWHSIFSTH